MQCIDHEKLHGQAPSWGLDGSEPDLKHHILCCTKSSIVAATTHHQQQGGAGVEEHSHDTSSQASPASEEDNTIDEAAEKVGVWFQVANGWNAGSHTDAEHYCSLKEVNGKRMELCSYEAYCPSGPSRPPVDGHLAVDGEESEQWAPTSNGDNQWVMVGMRGHNKATQCLTHGQLNGAPPEWGLDSSNAEHKHHIMCCYST